jgi:hypothetical protein
LTGKFQLIGEWTEDGSLESAEEPSVMDVKELNEAIRKKIYEVDLELLIAGIIAILGIHKEGNDKMYTLEVQMPLVVEGGEYDPNMLQKRANTLKQMQAKGYYLEGRKDGCIVCFKEGALEDMNGELEAIEAAISITG